MSTMSNRCLITRLYRLLLIKNLRIRPRRQFNIAQTRIRPPHTTVRNRSIGIQRNSLTTLRILPGNLYHHNLVNSLNISLTKRRMPKRKLRHLQRSHPKQINERTKRRIRDNRRPTINTPRIPRMRIPKILPTRRHANFNRHNLSRKIASTNSRQRSPILNSSLQRHPKNSRVIGRQDTKSALRFLKNSRDHRHQKISRFAALISRRAPIDITIRNRASINPILFRHYLRVSRILQVSQINLIIKRIPVRLRMRLSRLNKRLQRSR